MLDLDELERLCNEATPGPWRIEDAARGHGPKAIFCDDRTLANDGYEVAARLDSHDALFVWACRTAVPELIEQLRLARKAVSALGERVTFYEDLLHE